MPSSPVSVLNTPLPSRLTVLRRGTLTVPAPASVPAPELEPTRLVMPPADVADKEEEEEEEEGGERGEAMGASIELRGRWLPWRVVVVHPLPSPPPPPAADDVAV